MGNRLWVIHATVYLKVVQSKANGRDDLKIF